VNTMQKKILVVDDHPATLKLMTNFLEKEGHKVYIAQDGFAALEIIGSVTPDIIFMDLIIPKISGDVLCKAIRKMPKLINCYIVIFSAAIVENESDLMKIGADACISKGPFNEIIPYFHKVLMESDSGRKPDSQKPILKLENTFPRRITKELLSQNLHLKTILESMSEGILELYHQRIIYSNTTAAVLLGYTTEKLLGVYLPDLFDQNIKPIIKSALSSPTDKPLEMNENNSFELHGKHLMIRKQQLIGKPSSTIVIIEDLTERKRMESIAAAANLMDNCGYIVLGIRHELANPLNSIKMALTVLKKNLAAYTRETIEEFVDRSLIETSRIEYLLKTLKNFNMYESPQIGKARLDHFINNFISLVKEDFENKGIEIKKITAPDIKWGYTDTRALHQVLLNLMANAADALSDRSDPLIIIDMRKVNDWIEIQVQDNGCGIPEEEQENLFKPFFTSKQQGAGLGLVIVTKMLAKMNSAIHIESRPDVGTTVTVSIPTMASK